MSRYIVEDGVQIPEKKTNARQSRYPFGTMQVGQSVLITDRKPDTVNSAIQAIKRQPEHRDKKFVKRKMEGGVRVWRVK